jgi:ABC-2 type transport system permease protein
MRRKGSPWTGLWTVVSKETADHITSARMIMLQLLILFTAVGAVYAAIGVMKSIATQDQFLFLRLFTIAREPFPSFVNFLGFVVPIVGIALGFDAVNSEYQRRTMSRLLAQPIYRDALLFGKFLAALLTLGLTFFALWLLVTGLGLFILGVPPSGEEIGRGLSFLVVTIAYAGVWLAVAMMFSTVFRSAATSALASLATWLLFSVFWNIVAGIVAQIAAPSHPLFGAPPQQADLAQWVTRLSPNTLWTEATIGLLNPETRTLGRVFFEQVQGMAMGAPLPFGQSLLLVWPQISGLVAAMIVLFTVLYLVFQRQEVRA